MNVTQIKARSAQGKAGADVIPRKRHEREEQKADQRENAEEPPAVSGIFADVNAVIDDRGERADQGTESRGIQTVEQRADVVREGVKHDGGGDVGDHLTEQDAPEIFAAGDGAQQKGGNRRIRGDGGGKHKEAEEGQQQHIIRPQQNFAVDDQDGDRDSHRDEAPEGGAADDCPQHHGEDAEIGGAPEPSLRRPFAGEGHIPNAGAHAKVPPVQRQHKSHKKRRRHEPQREHIPHKAERRNARLSVDKEVLRAAEGGEQRAAHGGDIFHSDDGQDIPLPSAGAEEHDGQRDKDDQRDVVGDEHGREKDREHQKKRKRRHGTDAAGKPQQRTEDILALEALKYRQHHEKGGEGVPVDVREQSCRGRRDKQRRHSRRRRDEQHWLPADERRRPCRQKLPVCVFLCFLMIYLIQNLTKLLIQSDRQAGQIFFLPIIYHPAEFGNRGLRVFFDG